VPDSPTSAARMGDPAFVLKFLADLRADAPDSRVCTYSDSTDPAQIERREKINLARRSLSFPASRAAHSNQPFYKSTSLSACSNRGADKGGSTSSPLPPDRLEDAAGAERTASATFFMGYRPLGGRYSGALANFRGMVPAAVTGIDTASYLQHTKEMVEACNGIRPRRTESGVMLGLIIGTGRETCRDKITLPITSPGIADWALA